MAAIGVERTTAEVSLDDLKRTSPFSATKEEGGSPRVNVYTSFAAFSLSDNSGSISELLVAPASQNRDVMGQSER
jgi:hypothetical protein